jgi:hypothetical protein
VYESEEQEHVKEYRIDPARETKKHTWKVYGRNLYIPMHVFTEHHGVSSPHAINASFGQVPENEELRFENSDRQTTA